jgi:hypothetical protein
MGYRLQITISNQMYFFLNTTADELGISIAELCRRSLDTTYGPRGEKQLVQVDVRFGRRHGRRIP